ncbi:Uncharacterized membrane protein [Allokutzneria albata]|uniref:Uncharacterized membrane protein n=2 Tax=Allokutzneria albata TaxID=211114 RepID=A0A1G9U6W5_ALLAB|nr:Uncharacterized membrane protein [Allokutzneria albata]
MSAGLVLGFGLGGFVDGIVAHQLLRWHHMLSGWYPEHTDATMAADGLFHLGCLVVVLVGVALLATARPADLPSRGPRLAGWMLAGWGWFNLVEGIIDHHLLGVHHVRAGPHQLAYDLGFLAFGLLLTAAGTWLAGSTGSSPPDASATVRGRDLRRLLDTGLPDPALVLVHGRFEVAAADQRGKALEVISREELLRRTGKADPTDAELDQHARALSTAVTTLGG